MFLRIDVLVVWVEGDRAPYQIMAKKTKAIVTSVKEPILDNSNPTEFHLFQNYPNPFNANTLINFFLPYTTEIEVLVLNVRGQLVKTLYKGGEENGYHSVVWNGTDQKGLPVSSGIYLITLRSDAELKSVQVILLR